MITGSPPKQAATMGVRIQLAWRRVCASSLSHLIAAASGCLSPRYESSLAIRLLTGSEIKWPLLTLKGTQPSVSVQFCWESLRPQLNLGLGMHPGSPLCCPLSSPSSPQGSRTFLPKDTGLRVGV